MLVKLTPGLDLQFSRASVPLWVGEDGIELSSPQNPCSMDLAHWCQPLSEGQIWELQNNGKKIYIKIS